jgi:hypothetical protein
VLLLRNNIKATQRHTNTEFQSHRQLADFPRAGGDKAKLTEEVQFGYGKQAFELDLMPYHAR